MTPVIDFSDFIKVYSAQKQENPYKKNYFSSETEGRLLSVWHNHLNRLCFNSNTFSLEGYGAGTIIQITVPDTDKGIVPLHPEEQPYAWDGYINENIASMAVWWAFDIVSDSEADDFFTSQSPRVIFCFPESGKMMTLIVRYDTNRWIIESLNGIQPGEIK